MSLFNYLKSRGILLASTAVAWLFLIIVFLLDHQNRMLPVNLSYAAGISCLIFSVGIGIDFYRWKSFLKELEFNDAVNLNANHPEEILLINLFEKQRKAQEEVILRMKNEYEQNLDFFSAWIHELKTPSATLRLLAGRIDSPSLANEINEEILRLDGNLERALFFIRGRSFAEDFFIREVELSELIGSRIREYRRLFISRKIQLEWLPKPQLVNSDPLWLGFIFDQILQNALKYTPVSGSIRIRIESDATRRRILVSDTGSGIPFEDRNRIFRRGFTGNNGRHRGKATGMGLYLAQTLAKRLGHRIHYTPREEGSCFSVDFLPVQEPLNLVLMKPQPHLTQQ